MPRWPEWCRKVGETATHPAALNVGRKLLGYLATRRETPGVQTLVKRVTLDDGTTVEASFIGDQPQVIVYAPDGQEACELYVESGLLDLGPNIAPDANKRDWRNAPQFDDRPATLHFGDGVECAPGEAGLNGKVRVNIGAKTLKSECLPKQGRSVESRLRDPVKKQAQAMLPASCWSGLMQRYVQAVYGSDALDYSGSGDVLVVAGVNFGRLESVGLIEHDGALCFVRVGSTEVRFFEVTTPACAKAVLKARAAMKSEAHKKKLLTYALSVCKIGKQIATADLPTLPDGRWAEHTWAFSDTNSAVRVYVEGSFAGGATDALHTRVVRLTFRRVGNGWTCTQDDAVPAAKFPPCEVHTWGGAGVLYRPLSFLDSDIAGGGMSAPVSAHYDGKALVVAYAHFDMAGEVASPWDTDLCPSSSYAPGVGDSAQTMRRACGTRLRGEGSLARISNVVTGIVVERDGVVIASTVAQTDAMIEQKAGGGTIPWGMLPADGFARNAAPFLTDVREPTPTFSQVLGVYDTSYEAGMPDWDGAVRADCYVDRVESAVAPVFTCMYSCKDATFTMTRTVRAYGLRMFTGVIGTGIGHVVGPERGARASVGILRLRASGACGYVMDSHAISSRADLASVAYDEWVETPGVGGEWVRKSQALGFSMAEDDGVIHLAPVSVSPLAYIDNEPLKRAVGIGKPIQPTPYFLGELGDESNRTGFAFDTEMQAHSSSSMTEKFSRVLVIGGEAIPFDDVDGQHEMRYVTELGPTGFETRLEPALRVPAGQRVDASACPHAMYLAGHEPGIGIEIETATDAGVRKESPFLMAGQGNRTEHGHTQFNALGSRFLMNDAAAGLLDAAIYNTDALKQELPIAMDHQTITGGYPKVSTPSFVGWA